MLEFNKRCKTSMSHSSRHCCSLTSKAISITGIAGIVALAAILCGFSGSVEGFANQQGFRLSVTWSQVKTLEN
jgi:hypothetical protein